jgi:TIR domain
MMAADSGAGQGARSQWRWDVALSFAGAQRDYVEQVAQALQARGVRCFYDADEQIELWGKYLAEELPAIYGEQAAAVVVFVSAEYAAGDWTRLERRAALTRAVRERREYVLPARFDDTPLPGLLSDMVAVRLRSRTPQQFAAMIVSKLAAVGITGSAPPDAGERARDAESARPAGAVRAGEADPRRLGVHAAISVPGVDDEIPPEYVPRDVDAAEFGVRARVAAAAERGGFVLLVGGSSVGKTRTAVEAVKALLPQWWLVHPADPAEVAALARTPTPQTVVWLDELQLYLDGKHGLTGGMVRALLNPPYPAVIISTLWPEWYTAYTMFPATGAPDPYAREREVLDLAAVVRVDPEFSPAEQYRAYAAAARDPRLRVALDTAGYGLTQTMASAPQLVARWQDAKTASPYAWAVLTAALDVARLGARTPLSAELLRDAAPGYCTSQQQAAAPGNWFEEALAYATGKLHGGAAALIPAGTGVGQVTDYMVADYLIQHASRDRRSVRVPTRTWDAILYHLRDPADAARLAASATSRLLYRYAIPLYRQAADASADDGNAAARELARLLAKRGDQDEAIQILQARADSGDWHAALMLAGWLAERGDQDEAIQVLRARADSGDGLAAWQLADLLAKRGDLGGLRARAERGEGRAASLLAHALAKRGDLDGAAQIWRAQADVGDGESARQLARLLAKRGDVDGAAEVLRPWADAGDAESAWELAGLLVRRGDLDGLQARVEVGDRAAARRLAEWQAARGDLDGLRVRAEAGEWCAAQELARLLAWRGDLDGAAQIWRAQAGAGDGESACRLAGLLAERGDEDEAIQILRTLADASNAVATRAQAANLLAGLLAKRGDLDGLRVRAEAGDWYAARELAGQLAEQADLEGLQARAERGDQDAIKRLAGLLTKQGRGEEAEQLCRFGLNPDGSIAQA